MDKGADAIARQVGFILGDLGSQAAEQGLVATAEQAAYSLGTLGAKTSQRGLEDSTRQVAVFLRRVGVKAAEQKLDLVIRQALVSVWSLGAHTTRHLPGCTEVVMRELEMLEQIVDPELVDSSYLSTPGSPELEEFRARYLKAVRGDQKLHEQVIQALLDNLRDRASLPVAQPFDLDWIKTGERLLEKDPRWLELVVGFARRFGDEPEIAAHLEAQGFLRGASGWRREAEFLTEVGLVRVEDRVIRRERAILESVISIWIGGKNNNPMLLRGFTDEQFERSARGGKVKRGMNFREMVIARGYPRRITWLRTDKFSFEAWFYPTGFQAFFVDDLLFHWIAQ